MLPIVRNLKAASSRRPEQCVRLVPALLRFRPGSMNVGHILTCAQTSHWQNCRMRRSAYVVLETEGRREYASRQKRRAESVIPVPFIWTLELEYGPSGQTCGRFGVPREREKGKEFQQWVTLAEVSYLRAAVIVLAPRGGCCANSSSLSKYPVA